MKKRKSNLGRNLIILVVVGVVIGGTLFLSQGQRQPQGTRVTVESVSTGDITSIVTATGRIFPQLEVRISSEVPGEIVEMPVVDGQRVSRGDLLVRVNPDTLEAQVKQQEAALQATRAQSAQDRAQLLRTQQELRRVNELAANGFATADQLEAAETSVEIQRAALEASEFRIEQQTMLLREVQDQLAKASSFAPMDGTVTRIEREVGDRVVGTGQFEGTLIMVVSDLSRMEVQVEVSETDIVDVAIDQVTEIEIDALPDEMFPGRVIEIANSAQNSDSRDELTTFLVKIGLDAPAATIRPGMTATADIQTQTVTEALRVPLQAVTVRTASEVREALSPPDDSEGDTEETEADEAEDNEPQRVVFVVNEGDEAELRPVETGIFDGRFIEILDGLAREEEIVTGGYQVLTRELEHGDLVQKREAGEGRRGGRDS